MPRPSHEGGRAVALRANHARRNHGALGLARVQGTSLSYDSYNFPIFRITDDGDANAVLAGAAANRAGAFAAYPLYSLNLDAFMWATTDSATCLQRGTQHGRARARLPPHTPRRGLPGAERSRLGGSASSGLPLATRPRHVGLCDPVGGSSVWASVQPLAAARRTVMVSAPMDASAFFHAIAMGADADTTAVVALLVAAQAIGQLNTSAFEKDVVFALFDAEAWGYAGSQRCAPPRHNQGHRPSTAPRAQSTLTHPRPSPT